MNKLSIVLVALILSACEAPSPSASSPTQSKVAVTDGSNSPSFSSPNASPTPISNTVLRNWGWTTNQLFPLNFSASALNTPSVVLWYQYQSGFFLVSGKETRRYSATFNIAGDSIGGLLEITACHIVWSTVASEVNNVPCPVGIEGTHAYSVINSGMTLDGVFYVNQ